MGPSNGNLYFEDKPTANLSLTWVHGNHTSKIGGDWRIDVWTNRAYNQAIGNYTFSNAQTGQPSTQASPVSGGAVGYSYASFLLGQASAATGRRRRRSAVPQNVDVPVHPGHLESHSPFHIGLRPALGSLGADSGNLQPLVRVFSRTSQILLPAVCWARPSTKATAPAAAIASSLRSIPSQSVRASAAPIRSTPRQCCALDGVSVTHRSTSLAISAPAARSAPAGTPLPSRLTNNWDPALLLRNGMQYNAADLYKTSFDPGIRPQAGQINNPPNMIDPEQRTPRPHPSIEYLAPA
jgi:hypothetical protein